MKTSEEKVNRLENKTASLHNLGCKVNQYETDALAQLLRAEGVRIVEFGEPADICVINTCSVTNTADQKSRQMISRARKKSPDGIIVAAGCYVQTKEGINPGDFGADILIGNNEKSKLISLLDEFIEKRQSILEKIPDTNEMHDYEQLVFSETSGHTRAFVKVEDGCNDFCSYCIIPYARGRVRSRTIEDTLDEARALADSGYRELVVSGIHLPSFGLDTGERLIDLLAAIHGVPGIERIRLGSLEPGIITEEFTSELCKLKKVAPHFHLSLQSGCAATLKRMNRRYTPGEYTEKCELLRRVYDEPALTTDVICGFPGETDDEFEESYRFVRNIGFYEMHVFKYSRRHGTAADRMPGQLTEAVKAARSKRLIELSEKMSVDYIGKKKGQRAKVILEDEEIRDGVRGRSGFTEHYIKVFVPGDHVQGELLEVTV